MEPTTSTTTRDALAQTLGAAYGSQDWMITPADRKAAQSLISAGYRIPKVLGYVVVGRDGRPLGVQPSSKAEAQMMADEWTADARTNKADWDYRVAEIVEPTA